MKRVKMISKRGGVYMESDDDVAFRKNMAKRKRREFWRSVRESIYTNTIRIVIALCVVVLLSIAWNI